MQKRLLEIDRCRDCTNWSTSTGRCYKTKKMIEDAHNDPIPDDCPLPKVVY